MTVRIGIIGAGNISDTHARAAREISGVEIAAVWGQDRMKAQNLSAKYGGEVYSSLDEFMEHKPMDAVAIGSPSGLHAEHGIAAAQRGLHVLVEKPIDISTERADALIADCDTAGVRLAVFFQDRFAPDITKLKDLIDAGKLGRPILASARVKWHRPPEYYSHSRWRGTWKLDGGGALMNQGIHTVDLLLWLLGNVKRVYARAITALHRIEVEDTIVATLEFASGAIGILEAATSVYPGYRRRLELTGSEGTLILEHDRLIAVDLRDLPPAFSLAGDENLNASATSPVVSDVSGHKRVIEDFLESIQRGSIPRCDGREARRSVQLVQAIYKSSRTGLPVFVES